MIPLDVGAMIRCGRENPDTVRVLTFKGAGQLAEARAPDLDLEKMIH